MDEFMHSLIASLEKYPYDLKRWNTQDQTNWMICCRIMRDRKIQLVDLLRAMEKKKFDEVVIKSNE